MKLNKIYLIGLFLFFTAIDVFSQEQNIDNEQTILPISIYTSVENFKSLDSLSAINPSLDIDSFRLTSFNYYISKEGYFSIPFKKLKKSSDYVLETYQDIYNKRNLEKSFFDLSRLYLPNIPKK